MGKTPTPSSTRLPPFKFKEPDIDICAPVKFTDEPFLSFLACAYLVLGIYYITCGYRCFKASMFSTGFSFAVAIVYAICMQEHLLPQYGNITVSVCAGLLFGLITMLIQYVGIFVSGLHLGALLGSSGLMIYGYTAVTDDPSTYWMSVLIVFFAGIVFACLNLYWKKGLSIIATSVYGGALVGMSLDYYIDRWAMMKWVFDCIKLEPVVPPPCPLSWLALAVWPICAMFGIIIQWTLTGTGVRHEESLVVMKRRSKGALVHLTREQRAEMRQRKYRYLYQVRTAHGDVISQSYVQALQQKNSSSEPWNAGGTGECSTLQSDSTHLTVLASDVPHPDSDEDINQIRACH